MAKDFDVIVIGSGMGGLCAASLLAQLRGMKVLVLERHFKIGGFTHTFNRKGFTFDVGLHYVGDMQEGSQSRTLFDLVTNGGVTWQKMPEVFEKFVYPDFTINVPSTRNAYREELCKMFPAETAPINQYFKDVRSVCKALRTRLMAGAMPGAIGAIINAVNTDFKNFATMSTADYLNAHFKNQKLKAILTSQWGDYGLPPSLSSFGIHCLVVDHYFHGGYYPVGSAETIAQSIVPIIENAGGKVLANHTVEEIVVEGGVARGVIAKSIKGETVRYSAKSIISDAGLWITCTKLVPPEFRANPRGFTEELDASAITLYLGFSRSPIELGFKGENHWLFNGYDHDRAFSNGRNLSGPPSFAYLSFPSLKDPKAVKHTGQLITLARRSMFAKWNETRWKKRGADYEAFKNQLTQDLLDVAYEKYPRLKEIVEFSELSTPLTVESFTGHPGGRIYGQPLTPEVMAARSFKADTNIKNLYLAGCDVMALGIMGAFMGGVICAGQILGAAGVPEIMSQAARYSKRPVLAQEEGERPRQIATTA